MKTYTIGAQHWAAMQQHLAEPNQHWPHIEEILAAYAAAGCDAWEGSVENETQQAALASALSRSGLRYPSAFVGGCMHSDDWREKIPAMLASALRNRELGATLIVCNPDPIRWHGTENKTDSQLRNQSSALQFFAEKLQAEGMRLAYHWHDSEFRCGARELRHMLLRTDPNLVRVCFDTHWAFAGCGGSNQGMLDLMDLVFDRIESFHVRQVKEGICTRVFGEGDIDYTAWAAHLKQRGWQGLVSLEQSRNDDAPAVEDFLAAQQESIRSLRRILE